jgi:hypothetical protein
MHAFDHREMYETLVVAENVTIRYKDEARGMRLVGKTMFWAREFMTEVVTTIGSVVYFPSRKWVEEDYERAWTLLSHELVHVEDYQSKGKWRWLFFATYAMPQGLAILALLAIVLKAWWPLVFLGCLAPLPAPWRKHAEMRGYAMNMAVYFWAHGGGIPQDLKEEITSYFTGPLYFFMWPFKRSAANEVGQWSKRVLCDEIFECGPIYGRIQKMVKARVGN